MNPERLEQLFGEMVREEVETRRIGAKTLEQFLTKKLGKDIPAYSIENGILSFDTRGEVLVITDDRVMHFEESLTLSKHSCHLFAAPHMHNYIEMIYVYAGTCTQIIQDKEVTLNTGDICILDTNVVHSILPVGENDIVINILMRKNYFDTAFMSRLSGNDLMSNFFIQAVYQSKEYNNYLLFRSGSNEKIRQWMKELMCEYYDKSLCTDEVINCYIVLIFSELLRQYEAHKQEESLPNRNKLTISEILRFLENNYKEATLESTAERFHYHPNYLSTLLMKKTGKGFKSHLQEHKLRKACLLLKNTDLSIEEISKEVGYQNKTFFYKKFKAMFQINPGDYREAERL